MSSSHVLEANDCWMDYRLLMSKINIQTCRRPYIKHWFTLKFDIQKLTVPNMAREYAVVVECHLLMPNSSQQITEEWASSVICWEETMCKRNPRTHKMMSARLIQPERLRDLPTNWSEMERQNWIWIPLIISMAESQTLSSQDSLLKGATQHPKQLVEKQGRRTTTMHWQLNYSEIKVFSPFRKSTYILKAAVNITKLTKTFKRLRWQEHFSTLFSVMTPLQH